MDQNLILFQNSHKNILNIIIHIICGCLYISLISSVTHNYEYLLLLYSAYVFWLTCDIFLTCVIYIILYQITSYITSKKLSNITLIGFACLFYLLPEVGHIICDEQTVLSQTDFNIKNIVTNIFVLLPYSIISLRSQLFIMRFN